MQAKRVNLCSLSRLNFSAGPSTENSIHYRAEIGRRTPRIWLASPRVRWERERQWSRLWARSPQTEKRLFRGRAANCI